MSALNKIKNLNAVSTNEGSLILDSHKLSYHYDRVKKWENGEQIALSLIHISEPTRRS